MLISFAVTAQLVCAFVFAYVISYEACLCHGFTTKTTNQLHIHAFGSAPFLFDQMVITLTDNGLITEPHHEKLCLGGYRAVKPHKMARGLTFKK